MFYLTDLMGSSVVTFVLFRSKQLEGEAVDLRERIKHLNDMVFCQQRKVKGMIEEVICLHSFSTVYSIPDMHLESIHSTSLFPHFVTLQPYSKMDSIHYFFI